MSNLTERRAEYERKRESLLKICKVCRQQNKIFPPTSDRCDYGCDTGKRIRWLETEYSDVTGWTHKKW